MNSLNLAEKTSPAHGYPNIFETIFGPSNKRLQSKLDPKLGMAKTDFMWVCRALLFGSKTSHLGGSNGSSFFFARMDCMFYYATVNHSKTIYFEDLRELVGNIFGNLHKVQRILNQLTIRLAILQLQFTNNHPY